jgi:site-specific DNA-methyltransferase (adenine-specific)
MNMPTPSYELNQGDVIDWCATYAEKLHSGDAEPFHGAYGDPPYCLEFMGSGLRDAPHRQYAKDNPTQVAMLRDLLGVQVWEAAAILWYRDVFRNLRACLLPGAPVLMCAGPRTDDLMAAGMRAAGLDVRTKLIYLYGSGMPHGLDISKAIDGAAGAEREVIGKGKRSSGALVYDKRPSRPHGYYMRDEYDITAPATEEAARWAGYGTEFKPAYETLIYAINPTPGTYAEAALRWGTVGINVDASRIEASGRPLIGKHYGTDDTPGTNVYGAGLSPHAYAAGKTDLGRWPSNVLLQHDEGCGDDYCVRGCPVAMLDEQSGVTTSSDKIDHGETRSFGTVYGFTGYKQRRKRSTGYADRGGASRFFYTSKVAPWEREAGLDGMPVYMQQRTNAGGLENEPRWAPKETRNPHPTLKSIRALTYLLRAIGRPPHVGGRLLVPFAGTGSEMIAAGLSGGWSRIVGVELDQDERYPGAFIPIGQARIVWWSQFRRYEDARRAVVGERVYARELAEAEAIGQLALF